MAGMKVKKLIELLSKQDPEAEVYLHDHKDHSDESVLFVLARLDDDRCVWLESKRDCDYPYQLGCRFDEYFSGETEEKIGLLDFYTDLLDRGVTIDDVREYVSPDEANKMEQFCKENSLL